MAEKDLEKKFSIDDLYKNPDVLSKNKILISKVLNEFWEYDSVTGMCLPTDFDSFFQRFSVDNLQGMADDFEEICLFVREGVRNVIRTIHSKVVRDHVIMPVSQCRETDERTMTWLAAKPGRNIREKLSGKNRILAPIHYASVDTQENRIFKAFMMLLNSHFNCWKKYVERYKGEFCNEAGENVKPELLGFSYDVYRWLKSEDASFIKRMNNSVPNNTLLNDKHYRKIWKAWNMLQVMDLGLSEKLEDENFSFNGGLAFSYIIASLLWKNGVVFYQQPFLPSSRCGGECPLQHSLMNREMKNNGDEESGKYSLFLKGVYKTEVEKDKVGKELNCFDVSFYFNKDNNKGIVIQGTKKGGKAGVVSTGGNGATGVNNSQKICFDEKTIKNLLENKDLIEEIGKLDNKIKNFLQSANPGNVIFEKDNVIKENCDVVSIVTTEEQPVFAYGNEDSDKYFNGQFAGKMIAQKWNWEFCSKNQLISSHFLRKTFNNTRKSGENNSVIDISIKDLYGESEDSIDDIKDSEELENSENNLESHNFRVDSNDLGAAARIFVKKIRKSFPKSKHFVYVVPDNQDDFGENPLAVAINSILPDSVPLPRSIAAVFYWQKSKKFVEKINSLNDKNNVYVRVVDELEEKDNKGNHLIAVTDVKIVFPENVDENTLEGLKKASIPCEITWERQPVEVFTKQEFEKIEQKEKPEKNICKKINLTLNNYNGIKELVTGGLNYFKWQQKIINVPLWKDHLLELSMEADNTTKPIVLVGENTVVKARKGQSERIVLPVEDVLISKDREFVEFRLITGKKKEKQKYYAYLKNSNYMPFDEDKVCQLELFYTYGEQHPYTLYVKTDVNGEIKRMEVEWTKQSHKDYIHVPGPNYIEEDNWEDVLSEIPSGKKVSMLEFLDRTYNAIVTIQKFGWQNYIIKGCTKNNDRFFFTISDISGDGSFSIKDVVGSKDLDIDSSISCNIVYSENYDGTWFFNKNGERTYKALDVVVGNTNNIGKNSNLGRYIVPILHLWNQGRSLNDDDFDNAVCKEYAENIIAGCVNIYNSSEMPIAVRIQALRILAGFHEDVEYFGDIGVGKLFVEIMDNTLNNSGMNLYEYRRLIDAIGYAIGNVKHQWQQEILEKAIELGKEKDEDGENISIEIMGMALWRTRQCVSVLNKEQVNNLLTIAIKNITGFIKYYKDKKNKFKNPDFKFIHDFHRKRITFLRAVELILGVYRLRNETDDEEILKILAPMPDNKNIQNLKRCFSDLENFCKDDRNYGKEIEDYGKALYSRIQFEIEDENWDKSIPDFLYALEKFTKGESGGIKVLGITDEE